MAAPVFGASATGGGFGAPAATGGGFGATATTGGGFGTPAATGGGFGAPAATGGFALGGGGGFGASTGGGFGASAGGFGAPAATGAATGSFGVRGGATAGASTGAFGGFGATTGATGGGFGAPTTGPSFGAFGGGFGGAAGFGQPPKPAQQGGVPPPSQDWPNVEWKSKFQRLPALLQAKMNQHKGMVEDCSRRNEEIKNILRRRAANVTTPTSLPYSSDGLNGGRPTAEEVEDVKTERMASRLRHCLASLKNSLEHDSWQLQRQHEHVSREKQLLSTLRPLVGAAGTNMLMLTSDAHTHDRSHDRSLSFLQDMGRELHEEAC